MRTLARQNQWGPLATIVTLLAVAALIFGFIVFGPSILGTSYDDRGLDKYANNSDAGNQTTLAAEGANALFIGFYSGPLSMLLMIIGAFLIVAALAFAISINRKKRKGGM